MDMVVKRCMCTAPNRLPQSSCSSSSSSSRFGQAEKEDDCESTWIALRTYDATTLPKF
jgi:hypothetical protein